MEDNLTSADPLSYTTTIMIPGRPDKLSQRLLTCKNPPHSFLEGILTQLSDFQEFFSVFLCFPLFSRQYFASKTSTFSRVENFAKN